MRKSISHSVGVTESMLYGEGKFREESQFSLLTSRFRWREAIKRRPPKVCDL